MKKNLSALRLGALAILGLAALQSPAALACPPPAPVNPLLPLQVVELKDERYILADSQKLTAYIFDQDKGSESNCYGGCAKAWPPILVSAEEAQKIQAPVGTTTRRDGTLQITYQGKPLYLYVGDAAEGDITGDGLGGVWHIVLAPVAEEKPQPPAQEQPSPQPPVNSPYGESKQ